MTTKGHRSIKFPIQSIGEKTCRHCLKVKNLEDFPVEVYNKDGRKTNCRECVQKLKGYKSPIGFKRCTTCSKEKSVDEFFPSNKNKTGLRARCKECSRKSYPRPINGKQTCKKCKIEQDVTEFHTHKYCKAGIATTCKTCEIIKQYGLSYQEYIELKQKQNFECKICHKKEIETKLHVDHNHITGQIRGLLCRNCNVAIGLIREDINICKSIINYLEEYYVVS